MTECGSGKVGHLSEQAARRAAVAIARARTHDRPRAYACPDCHRWHLSSVRKHAPTVVRRRVRLAEPHPVSRAELDAWFAAHATSVQAGTLSST